MPSLETRVHISMKIKRSIMELLLIMVDVLLVADAQYLLVQLEGNDEGKQPILTAVLLLQILNYAAIQ